MSLRDEWRHYTAADGLTGTVVQCVFEDREGKYLGGY
jgi:hypothetical protein